jgi:hypothetical protein
VSSYLCGNPNKKFARQTRNLIEPDKVTAWIIGVSKSLSKSVDRFLGRLVSLVVALQPHLKVWAFSSTEEGLVPPERARPRLILVVFSPEVFLLPSVSLSVADDWPSTPVLRDRVFRVSRFLKSDSDFFAHRYVRERIRGAKFGSICCGVHRKKQANNFLPGASNTRCGTKVP